MRDKDLPTPNIGHKGWALRRSAVVALGHLQSSRDRLNKRHPQAAALSAFFAACKAASDAMLAVAPTVSFTPSSKSYSLAAGAAQAGPALARGGYTGRVEYSSATPAKATVDALTGAVTPVATGTSVITATFPAAGGFLAATVTYVATVTA